jgi:adenylate cyclase
MAIEIERKFLVRDESWRDAASAGVVMRQGYLSRNAKNSTRVRIAGEKAHLNIKSATPGCVRTEYEYPLPVAEAEDVLRHLVLGAVVEKTRYYVECDGFVFEIDEFAGANRGLVLAELELKALDQEFPRPAWLGPEISDRLRYYNSELAFHPFSAWTPAERAGA